MNNFEIEILNKIREVITPFFDLLFSLLTNLGGQEVLILSIIVIYFVLSKKDGQKIAYTIFLSLLINNAIKVVIDRIRPFNHPKATYTVNESTLESASGMSFPSGHSQNSSVTYFSIANNYKKKYLWIIGSVLVTIVGLSRIFLGVHYPTDVIAGIILGLIFTFLGFKIYDKYATNLKSKVILLLITSAVFLPFIFIYYNKVNTNYEGYKDLYTIYAFYLGYVGAVYLEGKFVDFNEDEPLKIRIIRAVIATVIVLALLIGLKIAFPKHNILFDMIRYFSLSFIGLGIYPIVFKNIFFKKK